MWKLIAAGAVWLGLMREVGRIVRLESELSTGYRVVPWREWLRRVRKGGRKWRGVQ